MADFIVTRDDVTGECQKREIVAGAGSGSVFQIVDNGDGTAGISDGTSTVTVPLVPVTSPASITSVRKSTDQAITANTLTTVTLDVVDVDDNSNFNPATSTWTSDGDYEVEILAFLAVSTSLTRVTLEKNGVVLDMTNGEGFFSPRISGDNDSSLIGRAVVTAGDTLVIRLEPDVNIINSVDFQGHNTGVTFRARPI